MTTPRSGILPFMFVSIMIALESSLWELTALEKINYHPAISTLVKSVGTEDDEDDKTPPMYDRRLLSWYILTYSRYLSRRRNDWEETTTAVVVLAGVRKGEHLFRL